MAGNNQGKGSRLLDALDSSMNPAPASQMAFGTPNRLMNALNATAAGSSTPIEKPSKDALREARLTQARNMTRLDQLEGDAQLILGSAPRSPRVAGSKVAGGFHLNYDDGTPVRAIDIGGPDQQLRIAEFVTKTLNNASHSVTVKTALKRLNLEDTNDVLPGMNVQLLPHQTIGVAWMLDRENSKDKGGILADDMGLGKTVQMIATMVMNQPSLDDEDTCKTTLVVVPAALLQQWKDEIESKTNDIMTVHVHHGKDKLKKRSEIKKYDVIVTTYQTLNGDFNFPKDLPSEEESEWLVKNGGILARTRFFRAIADEAQFIRNRGTRSSTALAHVQATYRWMLTGTPVTNTLADLYGLIRFGRFRPWNDWNSFNEYVAKMQIKDSLVAGERARAILAPLILRRTKDSKLEGDPILQLKPKTIELVTLDFSPDERDVYDSFENSSKLRLNKFIRERTLLKNHSFVLVMILRLRQLCCHPKLILTQAEKFDDPTDLMGNEAEKERGRAVKIKGRTWVEGILRQFIIRARANELLDYEDDDAGEAATCPVCEDVFTPANGRVLTCGHEVCFECILDIRNSPMEHNGIFGEGSEKQNLEEERKFEEANAKGYRKCPTCKTILDMGPNMTFKSAAFEPTDEELSKHADAERRRRSNKNNSSSTSKKLLSFNKKKAATYGSSEDEGDCDKDPYSSKAMKAFEQGMDESDDELFDLGDIMHPIKKQKTENKVESDDDSLIDLTLDDVSQPVFSSPSKPGKSSKNKRKSPQPKKGKGSPDEDTSESGLSKALVATWSKGDDDLEPSIKMIKLVNYIKEWEAIGDKTICYSQWTSVLDLIEILFSRHGIRSLRFDGKMDRKSRDHTLAQFRKVDGPKVILISTKSGGVGLNLVAANRIVNMDLSWNYAAESQAYDRAHRIGQDKPVYVKRLVVRNTIEERMLQLQDVKTGLAEAALGEGTGAKLNKLSMKDIKFLFGMTKNNNSTSNNIASSGMPSNRQDDDGDSDE